MTDRPARAPLQLLVRTWSPRAWAVAAARHRCVSAAAGLSLFPGPPPPRGGTVTQGRLRAAAGVSPGRGRPAAEGTTSKRGRGGLGSAAPGHRDPGAGGPGSTARFLTGAFDVSI